MRGVGRVADAHVQGSPKGGGALYRVRGFQRPALREPGSPFSEDGRTMAKLLTSDLCAAIDADPRSQEVHQAIARSIAGTSLGHPSPRPPARALDGVWMEQVLLCLPTAMRRSLEKRAAEEDGTIDEVIRAALVAAGHGEATDIAEIRDGTYASFPAT